MAKEKTKKIKMKINLIETFRGLSIGESVDLNVLQTNRESVRSTCSRLKRLEGINLEVNVISPVDYRVTRCL